LRVKRHAVGNSHDFRGFPIPVALAGWPVADGIWIAAVGIFAVVVVLVFLDRD